jgi:hypothetical protein
MLEVPMLVTDTRPQSAGYPVLVSRM